MSELPDQTILGGWEYGEEHGTSISFNYTESHSGKKYVDISIIPGSGGQIDFAVSVTQLKFLREFIEKLPWDGKETYEESWQELFGVM